SPSPLNGERDGVRGKTVRLVTIFASSQLHRAPRSFVCQRYEGVLRPASPQFPLDRPPEILLLRQHAARKHELNFLSFLDQTLRARCSIRRQTVRSAFENIARDPVSPCRRSKNFNRQRRNLRLAGTLRPTNEIVRLVQLQRAQQSH